MLDIQSTTKGFLPPRITAVQIAIISNPVEGLMVFNTDDDYLYFYDSAGSVWKQIDVGTGTITTIPTVTVQSMVVSINGVK